MARSSSIPVSQPDNSAQEIEDLADLNDDEGGELFRVTDELRATAGVQVSIVKLTPKEEAGYLAQVPIAEFSNDFVRDTYGAGSYKIRIVGPAGKYIKGGTTLIIGNAKKAVGGTSATPTDAVGIIAMLEARDKAQRDAAADRRSKLMELIVPGAITGVLGLLTALVTRQPTNDTAALIAALKPAPGPGLAEMTTALSNLNSLSGGNKTDPMEQIGKMLGLVKEFMPETATDTGKPGATNWMDILQTVIKEVGPAAKPILEKVMAAQQAQQLQRSPIAVQEQPQVTVQVPLQAQPQTTADIQPTGEQSMMEFIPVAKEKLQLLAKWAAQNRNPEVYAEVFVDDMPPQFNALLPPPKILEYLRHPQWWEVVTQFEPTLAPYFGYCDEFRNELLEIVGSWTEPEVTDITEEVTSND